jgi:hypothetical protein
MPTKTEREKIMKVKVVAILGQVNKGKKKEGSGMVNVCVTYPDGNSGVHVVYSEDIAPLHQIKVGDVIDINVKMEEFAFLKVA